MTIYGVANVGVTSTNGGSTVLAGGADGADSRIGFRGTEDLGGGLQAGFTFEAGLDATTGLGTSTLTANPTTTTVGGAFTFQRQAFARLASASLGEVRFGRQYTLGFESTIGSMPSTYTDAGLAVGLGFGGVGSRSNDMIQYRSPSFAGFNVFGSTQLSGDTTRATPAAAQNSELRLAYTNGPLSANANYAATKAAVGGATVNPYNVNATYDFGTFKLYGGYTDTATTAGKGYVVKGYMPMGSNSLYLGYANNTGKDASAYELGNYYSLSKRTSLYAVYGNGSNDLAGTNGNSNGRRWALGVHHSF